MVVVLRYMDLDAVGNGTTKKFQIWRALCVVSDMNDFVAVRDTKRIQCACKRRREILVDLCLQAATDLSNAIALRT